MDKLRVKIIIDNAKEKIKQNLSIKEEISALSTIYDYIEHDDDYKDFFEFVGMELKQFRLYQDSYIERKRMESSAHMKIQKENEYKTLWGNKSFLYKLVHRELSPDNVDLSQMVSEDINQLIDKLNNAVKKS